MAFSAAAMYGAAAFLNLVEAMIPGGESFSVAPGVAALGIAVVLAVAGSRIPVWALAPLGPLGAALIAYALATTHGSSDGAVVYIWPALWVVFFFGRVASALIVAWIGLVHAVALVHMQGSRAHFDRWLDVVVTVAVVAIVVRVLSERNHLLVRRLAGEARVDTLTGLLNRRGFRERMEIELAHSRRSGDSMAVVSLDVDYFKRVNDEWGHDTGDRVLARIGEVLRELSRETDVVARMGGEEFVALLPGCDAAEAEAFAERVRARLSSTRGVDVPRVSVSAGIAAERAPADADELLRRADTALYAAKRAGRDRVRLDPGPVLVGGTV